MEEIKSIRLRVNSSYGTDGKITISRVNNRKRIVTADRGVGNNLPELEFGNRYRDDSDDSIIENYLSVMNKDGRLPDDYEILQNPWSDIVPKPRQYGFEPYYLNNGSSIYIDWLDGTSTVGGTKWSDDEGNELDDIPDSEESKFYYTKRVSISPNYESGDPPMMFTDFSEIVKKDFNLPDKKFGGNVDDISIVESVIFYWKSQTLNYDDLDLCDPNNEFCNIIEYKSPIGDPQPEEPEPTPTKESVQTQGTPKIKLSVVLPEELELKVKEDLNEVKVYIGDPPLKPGEFVFQDDFDNLEELDPEYMEEPFEGEEEAEEVPDLPEDDVPTATAESSFTGSISSLPEGYSHTETQGYNILNSQWIGNLVASAKSHLKTPTWDVPDTKKGSLGCASAVSIIFYRAFGVSLRNGKAVREKPTKISHFGSKGTGTLAGDFKNKSLFQQIPLKDGQPGDIVNTARNGSTGKAGHIGIIIDIKHRNGSWEIISNSSGGFAGGGGGAVRRNYSIAAWEKSVTPRNPSQTFAYRYIGPKLSSQAV